MYRKSLAEKGLSQAFFASDAGVMLTKLYQASHSL